MNIIDNGLNYYVGKYDSKFKDKVIDSAKYSLLAEGKRVRPKLCLEFAKICGGNENDALPFACAVEMIHAYSLIHDDMPCMDDDSLRRGKPTNHIVFGEDIALIAGDAVLNMAFETLLSSDLEPIKVVKAGRVLSNLSGINGMIGGQCIDLSSEGKVITEEELFAMDMGKTVAIIIAAAVMGVISAGGTDEEQNYAEEYAKNLGMAFQIRDDILDVIGDQDILGKNLGSDVEMEKCNYVTVYGLDKAQELVDKYTASALKSLEGFSGDTTYLYDLAIKMQNRKN